MSWAIWVTGLPGSGKSTLASAAAARLAEQGEPAVVLELDRIRAVLTPQPTYGEAERETVYRSLVFMAVALTEAGVPVLIDATSHRRAWRDLARASIARFAEVQLDCPLDLCRAREAARTTGHAPRRIYASAGRPGATVPGVDLPYERARAPELTVDAGVEDVATAAERIAALGLRMGPAARRPRGEAGAVVWITGPPGSGKTTLASRLAEALDAESVAVTLLEWTALRAPVLGAGWASAADEEIAHRALAFTAKLLADAGLTVVVDATAPRRAWRELARTLVDRFAEVQLVCPADVCLERERAVRWRPRPSPHGSAVTTSPELAPEYEYSRNPDLVVDTAARSEWTAAEDLRILAHRVLGRGR